MARIQNDIRRIDIAPIARARTKTKFRKRVYIATAKSRSKKNRLSKSIKSKKVGKVGSYNERKTLFKSVFRSRGIDWSKDEN